MLDRNIRGIGIALCLLTLLLSLSGCGSLKDDTLLTVNVVITEVGTGKQTITTSATAMSVCCIFAERSRTVSPRWQSGVR